MIARASGSAASAPYGCAEERAERIQRGVVEDLRPEMRLHVRRVLGRDAGGGEALRPARARAPRRPRPRDARRRARSGRRRRSRARRPGRGNRRRRRSRAPPSARVGSDGGDDLLDVAETVLQRHHAPVGREQRCRTAASIAAVSKDFTVRRIASNGRRRARAARSRARGRRRGARPTGRRARARRPRSRRGAAARPSKRHAMPAAARSPPITEPTRSGARDEHPFAHRATI